VQISITNWIQGLLSGFVTIGRYGLRCATMQCRYVLAGVAIATDSEIDIATLVRCALAEVCTIPALCCHSNETCAPIADPSNSAQLEGTPYHSSNLRLGPCSSVGIRRGTDSHTDGCDYASREM